MVEDTMWWTRSSVPLTAIEIQWPSTAWYNWLTDGQADPPPASSALHLVDQISRLAAMYVYWKTCTTCLKIIRDCTSSTSRPDLVQISQTMDFGWTQEPAGYTDSASSCRVSGGFRPPSPIRRLTNTCTPLQHARRVGVLHWLPRRQAWHLCGLTLHTRDYFSMIQQTVNQPP